MEKTYWLNRTRASLKSAKAATSSRARLIHYELAGRYSLNALSGATQVTELGRVVEVMNGAWLRHSRDCGCAEASEHVRGRHDAAKHCSARAEARRREPAIDLCTSLER